MKKDNRDTKMTEMLELSGNNCKAPVKAPDEQL